MRILLILMLIAVPAEVRADSLISGAFGYDDRDRASDRLYYNKPAPTPREPEKPISCGGIIPTFPQDDISYGEVPGYGEPMAEEPLLEIPTHRHPAKGFEDRLRSYSHSQGLEDLTHGHTGLKRLGGPQALEGRARYPRKGGL